MGTTRATDQPAPPGDDPGPGVTDDDVLYPSSSAFFHLRSQSIRFPGDLDEGQRTRIQQQFDSGGFEPVPIQVTTRNRQNEAVRVRSRWDGLTLHLDVCPTSAPVLALRPALAAMTRFYVRRKLKLAALVFVVLVVVSAVIAALAGAV